MSTSGDEPQLAPDSEPVPVEPRAWRPALAGLVRLLVGCVVVGIVVGIVWLLVSPTPAFTVVSGDLVFVKDLPGEYVAMDGWFAVLTAVAGALVAAVVLRRRAIGPWTVVAVAVAGLVGSFVAWGIGHVLGPDEAVRPPVYVIGDVINGPLTLNAKGVLLIWPITSLLIVTFALAWRSRDEARAATGPAPDGVAAGSVGRDGDLSDLDRG